MEKDNEFGMMTQKHSGWGLRDLAFIAAPKAVNGIGTLGLSLVLIRYFGPESFGIYSLCVATVLLVDAVVGSAIDLGTLRLAPSYRGGDARRRLSVEQAAFTFKLGVALGAFLLLVPFAEPLAENFFQSAGYSHLIFLTAAASVSMLLLRSAQVYLQVEGKFHFYGLLDLLHFGLKFGGIALLLVMGKVTPGLVLAFFSVGPIAAVSYFGWTHGLAIFSITKFHPGVLRELLGYVKWFLLTFCLASLLSRVDLFLLSSWGAMREVGILSAAYVLALGFELLGAYLAVVYSPRVIPYCREGRFTAFYRKFQSGLLVGCGALFVGSFVAVRLGAPAVLPQQYAVSATAFLILLPGALAALATFPVTLAFVMFVRPRFIFSLDLFSVPILALLYAYAIPRYGALGAACVTSSGRLIKSMITQVAAWSWSGRLTGAALDLVVPPSGTMKEAIQPGGVA
jgi:O-antigen/teichoic acid export membrane protein